VLAGALAIAAAIPALAGADSFTPVSLSIRVAASAHVGSRLPITVGVTADPGVLDTRTAPLRVLGKLAPECGATFATTPGTVLINRRLSPQPATGRPYVASATGSGRPRRRGVQTVCVWLAEEGDGRVFASDQSDQVDVLRARRR
jgi:hypothetical protein